MCFSFHVFMLFSTNYYRLPALSHSPPLKIKLKKTLGGKTKILTPRRCVCGVFIPYNSKNKRLIAYLRISKSSKPI